LLDALNHVLIGLNYPGNYFHFCSFFFLTCWIAQCQNNVDKYNGKNLSFPFKKIAKISMFGYHRNKTSSVFSWICCFLINHFDNVCPASSYFYTETPKCWHDSFQANITSPLCECCHVPYGEGWGAKVVDILIQDKHWELSWYFYLFTKNL
jgi:hypothetical protein